MRKLGRGISLAATVACLAGCGQGEGAQNGTAAAAPGTNASAAGPQATARTSIAQGLAASPDHSTLMSAVRAAGLERTFAGREPYTLFAPTNAGFANLPGGGADLLAPEARGRLTALLTTHVVPGVVTADDLGKAIAKGGGRARLATVGGATLTATRDGEAITVGDGRTTARVTRADGLHANGVVHAIDGVLTPR